MERGFWEDKTLLDYFTQHTNRTPGKTFLVDPENKENLVNLKPERLSFEAVDMISDSVATEIIKKYDINKDDVIMIQLPNIYEVIVGILEKAILPVDPEQPKGENRQEKIYPEVPLRHDGLINY